MIKRDYNVDLFRIIATIFVVMLHVLGQGGVLDKATPSGTVYWVAWFMEILAYCAVDCFALISGYVMYNKTVKMKNIIGLWFQVLFYSLLLSSCFFIKIPETRTIKNYVIACFPILGKQWWYVSAYFALFFFVPILNVAIRHISKKTYEKFLIVVLIGICIFNTIIPIDAFALKGGYSAIWLVILYMFGAYINKYDLKNKVTASKSALAFFTMIILTFLSKFIAYYLTKIIFGEVKIDNLFISYTSITIVLASIFLLLSCLKIEICSVCQKTIHFFYPATLGVYLIHVHPFVFRYIIKNAFVGFANKASVVTALCVLAATLIIFLLCSAIDLIRIQLFKFIRVGKLCEIIDNKISELSVKIFKS